ncbi:aspartate/glutamate racemase family protein [Enterovibrio calviensis]|uniref:aspartate/glutamate racemase family protein n=1 Tax=Enterovibrio calviensis TaxID=91359 RepID=UPI000ACDECEC|nr:aspartate/glutamate racemase family protein [Enterovibrio calviensis]
MIDVINPNGSEAMTQQLSDSLSQTNTATYTRFHFCKASPLSIEGHYDGAMAAHHLVKQVQTLEKQESDALGYVVACFDDTGLDAVREVTERPVVGIGEAAMKTAGYLGHSFMVMTTLQRSVPIIRRNVLMYGLERQCAAIVASNIPVLSLETDPDAFTQILGLAKSSLDTSNSEVLILGCAGMSHWQEKLQSALGVPVIDGVQAAIATVKMLAELKLSTSKICGYAQPEKKGI